MTTDTRGFTARHTCTPLPSTFQMSTTGLSVDRSRYSGWGAPMTSRSAAAIDFVERQQVRIDGHIGIGAQHLPQP